MSQVPTNLASDEKWFQSKAFKRFMRNPLSVIGLTLLTIFMLIGFFAPVITAPQISERYRGHTCARDLAFPVDSSNWNWYRNTNLPNFSFFALERLPREDITALLRNPAQPYFWRLMLAPPYSCFTTPRISFSPLPEPPTAQNPMGIAPGGYDIFYGIVWGTRNAFYVGILLTSISLALGILIGGAAGFFGGWVDNVLMRIADTIYAFPNLILAMVFVTILGKGLTNVMVALAIVGWVGYARILRGDILRVRQLDYVDSARALGAPDRRVFFKHVLPNSIASLVIIASLDIGAVVLTVAGLAFLGLGAEVSYADWGQMINFARGYVQGNAENRFAYWYVSFWPGLALILFGLAWNLLGDAYRDAADVRSQ